VEVGASASLNLRFDRCRYRLNGVEPSSTGGSPVLVSCDVRGAAPEADLLGTMPEVTSRLGIDQEPIDVADADARAWLEAFIWPEDREGLAVLRSAMDLASCATSRWGPVSAAAMTIGFSPLRIRIRAGSPRPDRRRTAFSGPQALERQSNAAPGSNGLDRGRPLADRAG
jgi:Uncharacterized protein conserved in bacteria (DUF2332)